jgi:hypothetical protein
MKLQSILHEQIRVENKLLLENICHDLLPQQRYVVEGIYKELEPLIEASLTADQIKSLFGEVEKQSIAGGKSRTLTGGAVDVAKKANEVINNVGKWLQDTTPVKMADQKFEQLKAKVGEKFPELDKQLTGFGTWMKENPGKSAAIIGVMTALASLAGGPVGGAIAGQILRGSAELIKGEKLSTAMGKGIKTAALGFITGKAFEMLGNWIAGFREQAIPFGPAEAGLEEISWQASKTMSAPGMEWTRTTQGFNALVRPEEAEAIRQAVAGIKSGDTGAFDTLLRIARDVNTEDYKKAMDGMVQGAWQAAKDNDSILQFINGTKEGLQAGAQGAVAAAGTAADGKKKQESYYIQQRPLSEGQVYILFDRIEDYSRIDLISEGPMDALKKAGGAVAKGASWVGKQATEKITSAKLMASWKLAGSPTDSVELAKFLKDEGVEDSVIDASYTTMNLPSPSTAEKPADDSAEKQPLGTFGYDEYSGMAFANEQERAEYYQLIGKKDPGLPKKPYINNKAEPWDAEKFKQEELPYVQASDMVTKLPVDRKVRLLKALLKTGSTPAEQPAAT